MIEIDGIKFYTLDEIQELTGLSKSTLYNYVESGKLKGKKVGRRWQIPETSLKELYSIEEQ